MPEQTNTERTSATIARRTTIFAHASGSLRLKRFANFFRRSADFNFLSFGGATWPKASQNSLRVSLLDSGSFFKHSIFCMGCPFLILSSLTSIIPHFRVGCQELFAGRVPPQKGSKIECLTFCIINLLEQRSAHKLNFALAHDPCRRYWR